jgi:hypothetical protein
MILAAFCRPFLLARVYMLPDGCPWGSLKLLLLLCGVPLAVGGGCETVWFVYFLFTPGRAMFVSLSLGNESRP